MRTLLFAILLCGSALVQARDCNFSRTPPEGWQRMDTQALSLYLPHNAVTKTEQDFDATLYRFEADGLTGHVEYNLSRTPDVEDVGTVSRMLGGAPAFVLIEVNERDSGRLNADWSGLGLEQNRIASLRIRIRDASRWNDACRIAASVRLLGPVDQLQLVRIGTTHSGQRFAELRDGDAAPRRLFVGDYASQDWGRISAINASAVTVVQLISNGGGGFEERVTRLDLKSRGK